MRSVFPKDWRTQSRRKRRFYATYMRWVERIGYGIVLLVFAAFIVAFNYKVDDLVTADGVKIEPRSVAIEAKEPTVVAQLLVEDFEKVRKGQPLMRIARGEDAMRRFLLWKWTARGSAEGAPSTVEIVSPAHGTVRLDPNLLDKPLNAGESLARVVDYNDLNLTASLTGQTVAKAQVGQIARVTSITSEPESGVLFRGNGGTAPIISGRLLGEEVRSTLDKGLKGRSVQLRDDVPLKISEVTEVQIDAVTKTGPGEGSALPLDPPGSFTLRAQVVEGAPMATVQLADLPRDLARKASEQARKALGNRSVRRVDGLTVALADVQNLRMVVKLKATEFDGSGKPLPGVMLSRSFDATLKIVDPPTPLIDLVRENDRIGKSVTARVELRTGTRPIALLLLRKS